MVVTDGIDTETNVIDVEIIDVNEPPVIQNLYMDYPNNWRTVPEDTSLATNPANNNFFQVIALDEELDNLEYFITVQPDPGSINININGGCRPVGYKICITKYIIISLA